MAFCIQCGETIGLEAKTCPACGRAVGASSVGIARSRRLQPDTKKFSVGAAVLVVATAIGIYGLRHADTSQELGLVVSSSLVRVASANGLDRGGVIFRETPDAWLVATLAEKLEAPVVDGRDAVLVLKGRDAALSNLALVVVPKRPGDAWKVRTGAARPPPGTKIASFSAKKRAAAPGVVLSSDPDGILVHDAHLQASDLGFGLFDAGGKLAALATVAKDRGENQAYAMEAFAARLAVQEVSLAPGGALTELDLSLRPGTIVGVVALGVKTRPRIRSASGTRDATGRIEHDCGVVEFVTDRAGPLQLSIPGASKALLVAVAP